jgi:hypothetical protein
MCPRVRPHNRYNVSVNHMHINTKTSTISEMFKFPKLSIFRRACNDILYLLTNKFVFKCNFIIEFRLQCESYPLTSTILATYYYKGVCYVLHQNTALLTWVTAAASCVDFPTQPHKHLFVPNNDQILDWIYTKKPNTVRLLLFLLISSANYYLFPKLLIRVKTYSFTRYDLCVCKGCEASHLNARTHTTLPFVYTCFSTHTFL